MGSRWEGAHDTDASAVANADVVSTPDALSSQDVEWLTRVQGDDLEARLHARAWAAHMMRRSTVVPLQNPKILVVGPRAPALWFPPGCFMTARFDERT